MNKTKISALLFVLISVIFIFSSCSKPLFTKEFSPERAFTVHMTADKDGKSFEADIICNSYEDIEIKFTTPQELSGFSIVTAEDGYKVNVFGVPDDISEDEVNDASLLNVLIEALKISVFTNHGLFTEEEEGFDVNLTVDGIPVFVSFTKDGHIRRMEASMIGFYADFEISG